MPFYHPQWNEHDKPTVRCPHVEGRRIGDNYCQHVCPHLTRVIDRQYETIIDCGYTVRRSHTPDAGGCRLQTTIATSAKSAPAPREDAPSEEAKRCAVLAHEAPKDGSTEKTVPMERAHELKCEIREALRDLGLESVYAKGVADKTLDALEELEALAVTESAKEEGR